MYRLTFTKKDGTSFENEVETLNIQQVSQEPLGFAIELVDLQEMVPLTDDISRVDIEFYEVGGAIA